MGLGRSFVTLATVVVATLGSAVSAQAATTWNVTTTNDGSGTCPSASNCTLRTAIADAAAGDTVSLPASATHYMVTSGEIPITVAPLTLQGAGASSSVIDAQGNSRVFEVTANPASNATVTINDVTITGGDATSMPGGGAVLVDKPSNSVTLDLAITGSTITSNTATVATGDHVCCGGGGGIYSNGGSITLTNSSVSGNIATVTGSTLDTGGSACCDGGGGIYDNAGTNSLPTGNITLSNSTVNGNMATVTGHDCCHGGGGIYSDGDPGNVTISGGSQLSGDTFTLNGTETDVTSGDGNCCSGGGAIYQDFGTTSLSNTTLGGNAATVNSGECCHGGGAVFDDGSGGSISNTTLSGNTATITGPSESNNGAHCCSGGGAVAAFKAWTITDSTLDSNTSNVTAGDCCQGGGAIQFDSSHGLTVLGTTISNNRSLLTASSDPTESGGGGVYEDQGGTTHNSYTNSTISGNSTNAVPTEVAQGGGGIYAWSSSSNISDTLANTTVAGNSAPSARGGGIYDFGSNVQSKDSIVALNTASQDADCYATNSMSSSGTFSSLGYNLEDSPDTCSFTATGDKVVSASSVGLGPLQNNGGPTETMALLSGSPAIDAGNPAGCTDPFGAVLTTDQRGFPRPDSGESQCDIGAFETQPAPPVKPTLSGLHVSPHSFSLAGRKVKGKCVKPTAKNKRDKACKRPLKLTVSYTLNVGASVTFMLQRKGRGRKVKGKCVKPTKHNKHKPGCVLLTGVRGQVTQTGKAGANTFTLSRKLGPSTYLLTATASGGNAETVTFKIKS